MAPPSVAGKRVKGVQIFRPFIYGTVARPFDDKTNPKPPGVPDDHTHSWTVFVKGVDDADITYWMRRVQFKLHESIPNPVRMVEGRKAKPFEVHETGWGEFEITIKLYYAAESNEKSQTLYHHLRLHPYGRTDEERERMRLSGVVSSEAYDEQIFNEPHEAFYDILTSGALAAPPSRVCGGKGKGKGKALDAATAEEQHLRTSKGGVRERSAIVPQYSRPGMPFSRETELLERKLLEDAHGKVEALVVKLRDENATKERRIAELKAQTTAIG